MTDQVLLAIGAFALSFGLCVLLGKPTINWLLKRSIQDGKARKASETLNEINQGKSKVPTMGGLFIIAAVLLSSLVLLPLEFTTHWYLLAAVAASAALGAYDDWIKLTDQRDAEGERRDGMRGRVKFLWQAVIVGFAAYGILGQAGDTGQLLAIPFTGDSLHLGWLTLPIAVFVGVGTSNAVNLSDGLDGLASGMMLMSTLAFAAIALVMADSELATRFAIPAVADASNIAVVASILAGACLGFLIFNKHPAKVFMGDTGSLALGTALGLIAVSLRQELLLAVIGLVFVAEALSVILQVGYFKISGGKRIFLCSPLHHHFQFKGWSERKVTRRFWAASCLCCALGLFAFLLTPNASERVDPQSDPLTANGKSHDSTGDNNVDHNISVHR